MTAASPGLAGDRAERLAGWPTPGGSCRVSSHGAAKGAARRGRHDREETMTRHRAITGALALGLLLVAASRVTVRGQAEARPPYLDPDVDFEVRARDLVSRMSLEEKVSQLTNEAAAVPRLGVPAYDWWNECLHGVARAGVATVFPQAIGLAATFDEPLMLRDGRCHRGRGAGQAPPIRAPGEAGPLPGPHLLVAQHQHLPRPALGPGTGDVRRGPVSRRPGWASPS